MDTIEQQKRMILDTIEQQKQTILDTIEQQDYFMLDSDFEEAANSLGEDGLVDGWCLLLDCGPCCVLFPPNISSEELEAIRDRAELWLTLTKMRRAERLDISFEDIHPVACCGCGERQAFRTADIPESWECYSCRDERIAQTIV